jgi:hypothetical protein
VISQKVHVKLGGATIVNGETSAILWRDAKLSDNAFLVNMKWSDTGTIPFC